jgi:hypothetical protein
MRSGRRHEQGHDVRSRQRQRVRRSWFDNPEGELLKAKLVREISAIIKRRRLTQAKPVIGHLKSDGLMERNPLKGASGDAINVILTAAGHNLRLLLAWLRLYCAWIMAAITAALGGPHPNRQSKYAQV